MRRLDVQSNQIKYRGLPVDPLFRIGDRERSLTAMFAEFSAFGLTVGDLRYEATGPIQDQHVAAIFGLGYCKVAMDRVESNFSNWAPNQIEVIIKAMDATQNVARSIAAGMRFASHHLTYYCHARIQDSTFQALMKELRTPDLSSGGESLGTGLNFHWREPRRGWKTELSLNKSMVSADDLFLSFEVEIVGDEVKPSGVQLELKEYLWSILKELGLAFPEQIDAAAESKS